MFALFAFICFILAAFGVTFPVVAIVPLGLSFVALHLLLGSWPVGSLSLPRKN